jgi:hypothetical protein
MSEKKKATGHTSVIIATENMINLTLKMIAPILRKDATTVEIKKEAEMAYTADMQKQLKDTIFMDSGCSSWYKTAEGWNSTTFPYSQIHFTLWCMFPSWNDWSFSYTRKGIFKRRMWLLVKILMIVLPAYGILRANRVGLKLRDGPGLLKRIVSEGLARSISMLERLRMAL